MITADTTTNGVWVTSPVYAQDALDRYLADAWENVALGTEVTSSFQLPPRLYNQRRGNVYLFKNTEELQSL